MTSFDRIDNKVSTPVHHRSDKLLTGTFAGGCFWSIEAAFRRVIGVAATSVGYTGGHLAEPTYCDICTDKTGHAEAVRIYFDSDTISYEKLLNVFFISHDPTALNRQGPDVGCRYRSAIFYHNQSQRTAAEIAIDKLNLSGELENLIVTQVVPVSTFHKAEEYHQQYYEKCVEKDCSSSYR